jgi:cytochrome c biogenesis protein ResB
VSPHAAYRWFVSPRVTVALLCLLGLMLLLNVALPQATVLGEQAFNAIVDENVLLEFLLVDLGLGRMPTSPVFLTILGLFFLNLALVLVSRVGPTWRRVALKPRSEKGLRAWARLEESLEGSLPSDWAAAGAAQTLRGYGYQVRKPGERTLWGVKHRTAPLGFLLFHLSFFLICVGGMLIYYTRFVGSTMLCEGQEFRDSYVQIERVPPVGGAPPVQFTLERVDPRFEQGEPVHLGAVLSFRQGGSSVSRDTRVNHPARWGATSILVHQAGLAPVLWLQDARGFTIDRVVVPARTRGGGPPTEIEIGADGRYRAFVHPLATGEVFPDRQALATTAVTLQLTDGGRVVFDGELSPGEAAEIDGARLVLEELRYWAGLRIISERGGETLIVGFVIGVVGLVWRLLWYRREVALTWNEGRFRLVGRSEYFSERFQQELRAIRSTLESGTETHVSRSGSQGA